MSKTFTLAIRKVEKIEKYEVAKVFWDTLYLSVKVQQNGGSTARLIWPSVLNLGAAKVWGKWAYLGGNSQSTINSHQKLKMISTHKFVS